MRNNYSYEDKNGIDGIATLTDSTLATYTVTGK